ncbi:MAG: acyltransferase [Paludibacteraceae bacterium]|nr:acyltransferase [Paludibacteraceae bacterium]
MMQTNKNRIGWVDSMKAFSIMAVVLYHTQIMPEIKTAAYLVCLPAFFFVAGLFTNTSLSPKEFFLKKTLRLLIPYVIWGLLSWVFWYLISSRYGSSVENETVWWKPLSGMLFGRQEGLGHNAPLWFLCCMMSLEWIYYGVAQMSKQWVRWILLAGLGISGCVLAYLGQNWFWGISAALIILPLYALAAEYKTYWKEKMSSLPVYILLALLVCSLLGLWVGYTYNGDIRLCDSIIGNPVLYYLYVLSTVGLWLSIALIWDKKSGPISRLFQYIGRNTLFVLCVHIPAFSVIKGLALLCRIPIAFWSSTGGSIVLWISTFVLLMPLAWLVNRYCPIVIGKVSPFPLRTTTGDTSAKLSDKRL